MGRAVNASGRRLRAALAGRRACQPACRVYGVEKRNETMDSNTRVARW